MSTITTKLGIRLAQPEDMARIRQLHAEIEDRLGHAMDLPEVGDPAVGGYWVVERDGEIIGGGYVEKCLEWCQFGTAPEATAALRAFGEQVFDMAARAGARYLHCLVPTAMGEQMGRHLEQSGFELSGNLHYHRRLR